MTRRLPTAPLYIVSKGRADSRMTSKALEAMRVPYFVVIEEQEWKQYSAVIDPSKLLVLDRSFQRDYDTCDALGDSRSKGPGPARNFAWEHARAAGAEWHWVMDDNINGFYRYNRNLKVRCTSPAMFRAMEDFCARYSNVVMAGPAYFMWVLRKQIWPPFVANTRIYSCNLIRNDVPMRWRGRYNEDTDLSLCMLKAGFCTVQFNSFLQYKMPTQTLRGGNTDAFYFREGTKRAGEKYADGGTFAKSKMQVRMHPDCSRMTWRFGRWHHFVDYTPFKGNVLQRKPGVQVPAGVDDYGMKLLVDSPAASG